MGWLSAGLGLLGNIFSARSAESGASAANAANAAEAQKNRDFQLMMSSTAHQREVEDLRKAGLNPILSAMGGSGAPMGSGSMASFDNTKAISSNILANSAKMVSETMLNRTLAETERKKQENLDAQTANLSGNLNLFGVRVPLSAAAGWFNSAKTAATNFLHSNSGRTISSAIGKPSAWSSQIQDFLSRAGRGGVFGASAHSLFDAVKRLKHA